MVYDKLDWYDHMLSLFSCIEKSKHLFTSYNEWTKQQELNMIWKQLYLNSLYHQFIVILSKFLMDPLASFQWILLGTNLDKGMAVKFILIGQNKNSEQNYIRYRM